MKICTITCHSPLNYGAVLQAYALQRYFELQGHYVEIIDYRPDYLTNSTRLLYIGSSEFKRNIILMTLYVLRLLPARIKKRLAFRMFNKKYLSLTKHCYSNIEDIEKNPPVADIYFCGSDQIWNFNLPNGTDEVFYLSFINDNNKKNSYAASISSSVVSDAHTEFIKTRLQSFNSISVREDVTAQFLCDILGKPVSHVLDPVFLLSEEQWGIVEKCSKIDHGTKPYLLIYAMGDNPDIYQIATKIAAARGLEIYEITASLRKHSCVRKTFIGIRPDSFLKLFERASYVVTNSFHGTSFSIIFKKQFTVCDIANTNIRLLSILRTAGLEERFSKLPFDESTIKEIDYLKVKDSLEIKIKESKKFINDTLSKVKI